MYLRSDNGLTALAADEYENGPASKQYAVRRSPSRITTTEVGQVRVRAEHVILARTRQLSGGLLMIQLSGVGRRDPGHNGHWRRVMLCLMVYGAGTRARGRVPAYSAFKARGWGFFGQTGYSVCLLIIQIWRSGCGMQLMNCEQTRSSRRRSIPCQFWA